MMKMDTTRSADAESRIPTWASRSTAVVGAVLLALGFLTTTPAARIVIATFDDPAPRRTVIMEADERIPEDALAETDPAPRKAVKEASASTSITSPRPARDGVTDRWRRVLDPSRLSGLIASSPDISRKTDRPAAADRVADRKARMLASRVFVGLCRHLEAGLRHLTAPAFGSTAP